MIGATFCIVLTDAGNFPPPFRIDNFSEVPISYIQTGINDESLRLVVKPHHSKPFALVLKRCSLVFHYVLKKLKLLFQDEPTLHPHLTCMAPGGSVAIYDMNLIGEGSRLTYENFIYIVMTTTFTEPDLERIPQVGFFHDNF
jgi:vacuolar protein sorting-associated protein 13D